eukprot:CCRYP_006561-RB/>CCRYP_006561-RB protein AED:0.06 eAED:0.06 QI:0/0.66/0.5/0.75/0.66/0.5/4/3332/103
MSAENDNPSGRRGSGRQSRTCLSTMSPMAPMPAATKNRLHRESHQFQMVLEATELPLRRQSGLQTSLRRSWKAAGASRDHVSRLDSPWLKLLCLVMLLASMGW